MEEYVKGLKILEYRGKWEVQYEAFVERNVNVK